ncbi:MAG: hypothetical protein QOG03_2185, partial [Actinomycetota bacterium]|nr:hypothetical protein [Actinomycetota bacterium]
GMGEVDGDRSTGDRVVDARDEAGVSGPPQIGRRDGRAVGPPRPRPQSERCRLVIGGETTGSRRDQRRLPRPIGLGHVELRKDQRPRCGTGQRRRGRVGVTPHPHPGRAAARVIANRTDRRRGGAPRRSRPPPTVGAPAPAQGQNNGGSHDENNRERTAAGRGEAEARLHFLIGSTQTLDASKLAIGVGTRPCTVGRSTAWIWN